MSWLITATSRHQFLLGLFLFVARLHGAWTLAKPESPKIVVAGAGPASLIFALRYLQLNPNGKVQIFEQRSKPPRYQDSPNECVAGDNAFGFGISTRAQSVLKGVPGLLQAVEAIAQPTVMLPGRPPLWIVNRRELCAEMIHKLEQEYCDGGIDGKGRLQLHFNCAITDIQTIQTNAVDDAVCSCAVVVEEYTKSANQKSTTTLVPYSLLIGADGTHSAIRTTLARRGLVAGERYVHGTTWKALQLPAQPQILDNTKSLAFRSKEDAGRLLPRFKDRFVFLNFRVGNKKYDPSSSNDNNPNPFSATTPQELREGIQAKLPNVTEFPSDEMLQVYLDQPAGHSCYMTLDRHYVPEVNTILIGDAAVGMYSMLGQGCAYAMDSANMLAEELAAVSDDDSENSSTTTATLDRVAHRHMQEGKAIADLNLISHLMKIPVIKILSMLWFLRVIKPLNNPEDSYSAIARRSRLAIRLSKLFWKRTRTLVPIESTKKKTL